LTSIARNRAIDSLRRAQTQPQALERSGGGDDGDPDGDDAYAHLADESGGPLELLSRASDARSLGECMGRLSAAQRQSVALAFYDGLSHVEVAERLREPLGTVKSWVRRALLSLKNCLERAVERDASAA
jgi:RNA polymerase sigma-70 factor (ECF subfamily)